MERVFEEEKVDELEQQMLQPMIRTGKLFYAFIAMLIAVIGWAGYAYHVQYTRGLIVTGMRDVILWGIYITNFVFFIGISHAGTLISAILRVSGAEWRRPITRMAEAITVFALMVGATMVLIDLGRPDRLLYIITNGRLQSPILWDFISIGAYITGSIIYLYLPLIPDMAICKNKLPNLSGWKRRLYGLLSVGWTGNERQKKRLKKSISIMAILIIPIAVSVHTVVSWMFAMTMRHGWHSTIFGPYFVVGAIFSGIAGIILAMAIFRRVYHLEGVITRDHFNYLGLLLLTLDVIYIYFTISEYLTAGYVGETAEARLLRELFRGQYAYLFWSMILIGFVLPAFLLAYSRTRTIKGIVVASVLVNIAMWIKRYIIIIPTLSLPLVAGGWGQYTPTWVELSITAGAIAGFILLYTIFSKIFPIISLWEVKEGQEKMEPMTAKVEPEGVPTFGSP
ncbi:MAG: NrfD/PsrC family molybdoenzyme membrane anchor subunit [Candidatus Heimdallarchaeota archaeon]